MAERATCPRCLGNGKITVGKGRSVLGYPDPSRQYIMSKCPLCVLVGRIGFLGTFDGTVPTECAAAWRVGGMQAVLLVMPL